MAEDGQDTGVMSMGTYVNPQLALHSDYFGALDRMMKCVDRNSHVQGEAAQERACAKEYKALRMQAFQ